MFQTTGLEQLQMKIKIHVVSKYIQQQSNAANNHFVFSYTITIENTSTSAIQLISRHWLICDANNKTEEVYGEGVVGEQPVILPGHKYTYSSGSVLETEMGTMEGRYFMQSKENGEFEIAIPKFLLSIPRTLH